MNRRSLLVAVAALAGCGATPAADTTPSPADATVERFETDTPTCASPLDAATPTVDGRTVRVEGRISVPCGGSVDLGGAVVVADTLRVELATRRPTGVQCRRACAAAAPYDLVVRTPGPPDRVVVRHDGDSVATWPPATDA